MIKRASLPLKLRPTMPRKILIPLVLLLLFILAAALLIPLLLDKEKVLQLVSSALHEKTGATLTVGDATLNVLPTLGIALSDAAVTLPHQQQPDLRVGVLQIGVQFLPLIRGRIEIDTIALDQVNARLGSSARTATSGTPTSPGMASGAESSLVAPMALRVRHLTITDAHLELLDPELDATTLVDLVQLEARDLNLDGDPMPVDMTLQLPGRQVIQVHAKGNIRFDQRKQTATLDQLELAVTGALANILKLRTSGTIDLNRQSAQLQLALEAGETRGDGTLRYSRHDSPRIDSVLQLNQWDPALLALAGPEAVAAKKESAVASGDVPLPLQALRSIDAHTVLDVEKARFGALTVNKLHVNLRALDGLIQATDVTGGLYGGTLSASASLDGTSDTPTLETRGSLRHLDIATALAAAQEKPALTGSATVDWHLNSEGASRKELTAALQGPLKLTTDKVVLQGLSVEKLLCQTMALTNREQLTADFPANTRFTTLSADVQIVDGRAVLDPLRGDLTGIALTGSGSVDLLQKNFAATVEAHMSPELEQLDHACRVSKRLTALDLPVNCAGTIGTEPATWCRVDAAKALRDMTVNEGREKLEKKAGKLLDKLFNKGD
ncbi:MAG TPA: AsmA family protein [Halioglobus sp.]